MLTAIAPNDCIWAETRQVYIPTHRLDIEETEVFCTHSHNEGGFCKVALGEGCEYQEA